MKNYRTALSVILVAVTLVSCTRKATITGIINGAAERDLTVKMLDVNVYNVLDTIKTGRDGSFTYKVDVAEGQPEFIYLFFGNTKIASLLLSKGENVKLSADTLGNYSVEGSEESLKLQQVENDYAAFFTNFVAICEKIEKAQGDEAASKQLQAELNSEYVKYYRSATHYVLSNAHSLTVVPVLFQKLNDNVPVFSQQTDALLFSNICDSLRLDYPDSKYLSALEKEANVRKNDFAINIKLQEAERIGYPDLNMPDINGQKVSLASLDSKVILVHFWSTAEAGQAMFNTEKMKPLYEKYHPKGFDIYQICVDTDKTQWASVVKGQELPWTNVCDGLGDLSPALSLYAIAKVPAQVLIVDGEIYDKPIKGESELTRLLDQKLK